MCVFLEVIVVSVTIIVSFVTYYMWAFSYWKRKGIPHIKPTFPFGTLENPITAKDYIGVRLLKQYQELKSKGYKHGGLYIFTCPVYLPIDPTYIKNILSKDFQYFSDHGIYYNERDDPLSANLFNLGGQKWKALRTRLTPAFTPGKIKTLFNTLLACSDQLMEAVNDYWEKHEPIDMKNALECFTTDIIGSCAFGLECNSFKNPNSKFREYGKQIFVAATKRDCLKNITAYANQNLARLFGITTTNSAVADFFMNIVKDTVRYRKETNFQRKDFMQILIDLNTISQEGDRKEVAKGFTVEEMAAQVFIFFMAGYETSSTTMSFCLFELAMNPDIQEKLRKEVVSTLEKCDGEISYEAIMEMSYMNQVVDETLRKYPPASVIPRICVDDYQIPGTDITLNKGTRVIIPALPLHRDPEFYPDPEKFDPERFTDDNKQHIQPYTYIPFGEGPRMCIALRFGLLQTKLGLTVLLKRFRFKLNERTKLPLVLNPSNFILQARDGLWLDVEHL